MSENRYYLQLHFIILLNSFFPTMVSWIRGLNSVEIAFLRAITAVLILTFILHVKKISYKIEAKAIRDIILSGALYASFLILTVYSTVASNASVTLVGLATTSLWVTFVSPIITDKKWDFYQMMTGLNAVFGIFMIFSNNFQYGFGMIIAILAAFVGGIYTVINGKFAKKHNHLVVTFYQMIGAGVITAFFLPLYGFVFQKDSLMPLQTIYWKDLLIVFIMTVVLSVFASSQIIKVMKKLAPFTVAITTNLSPIYGVLIALILSDKDESMNLYFYSGALIIIASVMAFPLVQYFFLGKNPTRKSVITD